MKKKNDLLKIDSLRVSQEIIKFLKREFQTRGKKRAILGLSGGIDSALTALLCKKAGLDLWTLILPYNKRGLGEAKRVIQVLGIPKTRRVIISITKMVNAQIRELKKFIKLDQIDKGNLMARQRMIVQYALARKLKGLVVGTENLSEYYLGYFTLHGDQACDINPLGNLFKTQVRKLACYLGLPQEILKKAPSAGLWKGQTDEKELGFSYQEGDPIIYLYKIKNQNPQKIIKRYGFKKELVNKVIKRIKESEYKRQGPPKYQQSLKD